MRRALLAARLACIWFETWPALAWATITITHPGWVTLTGTTIAAVGLLARSWRRGDWHKNLTDTLTVIVRHQWPDTNPQLLAVTITHPYTPPQAVRQRRRTGHWGIPATTMTLTVRGATGDRQKVGEWAMGVYEYTSVEVATSIKGVEVYDIHLTQIKMPELVKVAA